MLNRRSARGTGRSAYFTHRTTKAGGMLSHTDREWVIFEKYFGSF
jgi:hypothetical protein